MGMLAIGLLIGCALVAVVYYFLQKQIMQHQQENALLKQEMERLQQEVANQIPLKADNQTYKSRLEDAQKENMALKEKLDRKEIDIQEQIRTIASYKSEHKAMQEKIETQKQELQNTRQELNKEFKLLANEILEEKTKRFSEVNEEKIGNILNPLKEKIQLFEKKVEETYNNETREKASLRKELDQIISINKQMSDDAQKLTWALKGDSKIQGDWGEMQLEILLEKSGLERNIHFLVQENYKTEAGANVRPDFIINLPDSKNYIIDCKVSLTAYERYFNAETDEQRNAALKEHLLSMQKHIADLSAKSYQNLYGINAPDFVFLYVPIEPALTLALQNDAALFDKALNKNIVLISTSTLLATMRTVSFIWKQENQKNNVIAIAQESGALYDKFVGFTEDMLKVGKTMDDSKKVYADAMNKLCDSSKKGDTVIGRLERIKKLGANATKSINKQLLDKAESNLAINN